MKHRFPSVCALALTLSACTIATETSQRDELALTGGGSTGTFVVSGRAENDKARATVAALMEASRRCGSCRGFVQRGDWRMSQERVCLPSPDLCVERGLYDVAEGTFECTTPPATPDMFELAGRVPGHSANAEKTAKERVIADARDRCQPCQRVVQESDWRVRETVDAVCPFCGPEQEPLTVVSATFSCGDPI